MNKDVFLVESKYYDNFIEAQKDFYGDDYDKDNYHVVVVNKIDFVDSETFRIEHGNVTIEKNDVYLYEGFDGYYGFYNKVFVNGSYTYYCLDGAWYER
jgi:hypothetical protein